jgi:hypothetical protein
LRSVGLTIVQKQALSRVFLFSLLRKAFSQFVYAPRATLSLLAPVYRYYVLPSVVNVKKYCKSCPFMSRISYIMQTIVAPFQLCALSKGISPNNLNLA